MIVFHCVSAVSWISSKEMLLATSWQDAAVTSSCRCDWITLEGTFDNSANV